jgi:hypothetical protein
MELSVWRSLAEECAGNLLLPVLQVKTANLFSHQQVLCQQDEVATQKAAVEALEDKRRLEAAAAVAAKRNSDAEASAAAERLATVRAAAQDETNALQAQVTSHRRFPPPTACSCGRVTTSFAAVAMIGIHTPVNFSCVLQGLQFGCASVLRWRLILQVRSLRADVVALEVAAGDAERRVQVAEEAAAATRQQLQEAEEQVHTLALADAMLSLLRDAA